MKFLFDFFPVILFFVVFKFWGIYNATIVAIVATLLQIAWAWYRHRKIDGMQWMSLGVIVVFGGATLVLHDESFIKWKPTVLYWLFSSGLVISYFGFGKNIIRSMLEKQMTLPDPIWRNVMLAWAGFFLMMGGINLWVAFNFSTDTWVDFKLFGGMGLMVIFVLLQAMFLSKHMDGTETK